MPFQLDEIANDPDLGENSPIIVFRTFGQFGAGGWKPGTPAQIPITGIISVAGSKELKQIPEGDRVTGALQLVTATQLYQTSEARNNVSDKIFWRNNYYQIMSVDPWGDFGFWSAILLRLTGS